MRMRRANQDLHLLNEDGMVACNPRDREAAHRAEMEGIATQNPQAGTCTKCRASMRKSRRREGQVEIRRRDGQCFVVPPTKGAGSPLDVPGVDAGLSREEVVALVRESRQSTERLLKGKSSPAYRFQLTSKNRGRLGPTR
jgi:hypothetical protein